MTYNFDPDRWYKNQRKALDARRHAGEIDDSAFAKLLEELDRRYDELVARLDGSFRLPEEK